jgi:ribosome-associated protein
MAQHRKFTYDLLANELVFTSSRSSGPGGQNVNKVNSKVTLKWDVLNSQVLDLEEKDIILKKLSSHLTNEGILMVSAQEKDLRFKIRNLLFSNWKHCWRKHLQKRNPEKRQNLQRDQFRTGSKKRNCILKRKSGGSRHQTEFRLKPFNLSPVFFIFKNPYPYPIGNKIHPRLYFRIMHVYFFCTCSGAR